MAPTAATASFTAEYRHRKGSPKSRYLRFKNLKYRSDPNNSGSYVGYINHKYYDSTSTFNSASIQFSGGPTFRVLTHADDHYASIPSDTSDVKYISIFSDARYAKIGVDEMAYDTTDYDDGNGAYTVSFWLFIDTIGGIGTDSWENTDSTGNVFRTFNSSTQNSFLFRAIRSGTNRNLELRQYFDNGGYRKCTITDFFKAANFGNQWAHITVKFAGSSTSNFEVYANGTLQSSTTTSVSSPSGTRRSGDKIYLGSSNQDFRFYIDEVAVYTSTTTNPSPSYMYNDGKFSNIMHFSSSNLVHYWRLGDGDDASSANGIKDYVGTAHLSPGSGDTISFSNRTSSFRKSALKTEEEFATAMYDKISASLGSEYDVNLLSGQLLSFGYPVYSIQITAHDTGSSQTIDIATMTEGDGDGSGNQAIKAYSSYSKNALEINSDSTFDIDDTITIEGTQYDIGHHSPQESGDFNTYTSDSTRTRAIHFLVLAQQQLL